MTFFINNCKTIAALLVFACGFLSAQENNTAPAPKSGLQVHNLFQSNMIIQRSKPVDIWGWSKPGDKVSVEFAGKTVSGTADKE